MHNVAHFTHQTGPDPLSIDTTTSSSVLVLRYIVVRLFMYILSAIFDGTREQKQI